MRVLLAAAVMLAAIAPARAADDVVVTEGVIDAPVAEVWRAWTTKAGMESWMVGKTDFELKVGALYATSYDRQSTLEDDSTIHQQLLAYDPERMIATRTVRAPRNFPFPNAIVKTWTVTYFEPLDGNRTRVTARMSGYTPDEESQKMRAFFERGNKATLDSLARRFSGRR